MAIDVTPLSDVEVANMVDVWSGDITLPDGNVIAGVGLASPNPAASPTIPTSTLRFLSTVDTAKIPLYLSIGPSYEVWTTSEATEEWFESLLLSKPLEVGPPKDDTTAQNWWNTARHQSPIGFLVEVKEECEAIKKPRVTEILFYGTIAAPPNGGLPTPPSSSPNRHDAQHDHLPELRVHALPLSSDLLYHPSNTDDLSQQPAELNEPQFLTPVLSPQSMPGSPKRKRDIFDEATIANKKSRGKGGIGIAAAAARGGESQNTMGHRNSLSIDSKAAPYPDYRPPSANAQSSRPASRQLSRSPSICSDGRPLSRKGAQDGQNKRSNLSRVATVSSQTEEPTTESRNKEALSKVVMAAMRMHGLQQRKKNRSRRESFAPGVENSQSASEIATAAEAAKDEEYKLVYHQTFKGAAFAFRQHMATKPLHSQPDRLRDAVERLLTIFLTDPLTLPLPSEEANPTVATPGSKQRLGVLGSTHSHQSPFDLPSASRPAILRSKTDSHVYTGSPVSRKKNSGSDMQAI